MEAFVEVIELSKSYPARREEAVAVFAGLNLTVEKGASVAIVGPSGSAKK